VRAGGRHLNFYETRDKPPDAFDSDFSCAFRMDGITRACETESDRNGAQLGSPSCTPPSASSSSSALRGLLVLGVLIGLFEAIVEWFRRNSRVCSVCHRPLVVKRPDAWLPKAEPCRCPEWSLEGSRD
jgi:hypothetical protein